MKATMAAALAAVLCWFSTSASAGMWDDLTEHVSNNWTQSKRAWDEGRHDLYLSGYTWHLPYAYTSEQRSDYTNNAWGGGIGKSVMDDKGRTHGLFFMAFDDSHGKPQYNFGYSWTTYWDVGRTKLQGGLGYTAFFFMRSDMASYLPIPAILPLASVRWDKKIEAMATFVPGFGDGNGNVLFFFGRISFP
jgi:palmitoyl transferase